LNTALKALRANCDMHLSVALVARALRHEWAVDFVTLNTLLDSICVVGAQVAATHSRNTLCNTLS